MKLKYGESCIVCGRKSITAVRGTPICGVCLPRVQELLDVGPDSERTCKGPRTVHCNECVGDCPFDSADA